MPFWQPANPKLSNEEILEYSEQAKQAMTQHNYKEAYRLLSFVPDEFSFRMALLVLEHEVNYLRSVDSTS